MEEIKKGLTINNRFTLEEFIGSGSFGEVWRAKDINNNKIVAIKIYISLNKKGCEEFMDEYKIASGLNHKNLVVTDQYAVWENRPYLTMKYCAKGSASTLVGKLKPCMKDERLIWTFIRDVAAGLTYLHNLEPDPIVHQDIKPDNVLMDSNGSFLITDFGISKKVRATLRSQSTRAVNAGAVAYMAPERFKGNFKPILASDVWSLGASIFELAEGELPFAGMGGGFLNQGAEMANLSKGWTENLNELMHFCLEKETWDRAKAHEVYEIANNVIDNDLKVNVASIIKRIKDSRKGNSEFDPRATRRKPEPPKPEPPKPEPPKPEQPKPEPTSLKGLWYFLAAIAACLILYFGFFHESAELKDAKLHNEAYTTLVSQCSQSTELGDGNNTQALLNAKQAYSKIVELEKDYAAVQPEFYNKAASLKEPLESKLSEAANAWAEAAKMQVENLGDYRKAIEFYQLASSLWNGESIKQSFENVKKATAYMYIKECKFANTTQDNKVIDDYGATLYSTKLKYLCPKIYYDGLSDDSNYRDLYIKVINPDGSLRKGASSPAGYSYKENVWISSGKDNSAELGGWGNNDPNYEKGTYTVEIWYNKKVIYSTTVQVK